MIFPAFSLGRVFGHFLLLLLLPLSLISGLRMAVDNPLQPLWLSHNSWLPEGAVFQWHQWAAYGWLLLALAAILQRLFGAPAKKRRNTLISALYYLLSVQILLGLWLYLKPHLPAQLSSALPLILHYVFALTLALLVLAHALEQLLIKRGRYLCQTLAPKAIGGRGAVILGVAASLAVGLWQWDKRFYQPLTVAAMAPLTSLEIDGEFNESEWQNAPSTIVITTKGNDYNSQIPIEIKALHNGLVAYFAIRWPDDHEDRSHLPLQKTAEGWTVLHNGFERDDERTFYEDKFAVMLSSIPGLAGAASIHMGSQPAPGRPANRHGRGYHYTLDGSIRDVWHWKALRGDEMAALDDDHFGPLAPNCQYCPRYTAGYHPDPQESGAVYNNWQWFLTDIITPLRLPRYPQDIAAIKDGTYHNTSMPWRRTSAYQPSLDDYPIGTVLPSVVYGDIYEGDRADVRAKARWHDGYWQLELARGLNSESPFDLPINSDTYLWLAPFDHAQTRHAYHLRPLRLQLQDIQSVETVAAEVFR